ncbi:DMT family transporter [Aureibaculum marinum]|uniref:DMT family transporter n=1 Tax=Aureibaculum marinum TaxID=2487930 RepID=A0A3N4NJ40_9FLAO|nr:DMT family transporter [Aureibaculum marinum]RPD93296.1 DMT family transporter [Aureibaculum marinum]
MNKPRLALAVGIICISIFPVLVKLSMVSGIISAFYRMAFSSLLIIPYVLIFKSFKFPTLKVTLLSVLCGVIFASDVTVWNIAIINSTATQASLLTNLSPIWVGIGAFFFLKDKPKRNFWIGTIIAILGMILLVGVDVFKNLDFDIAFAFGVLSGVLYAFYMLISKNILNQINVWGFMSISLTSATFFLGILSYFSNESFTGFSGTSWIILVTMAVVCQLTAWLLISYATQNMRATRVSVSLLGQAILASILAWLFLNEEITLQMIFGGIILLFGIWVTFFTTPIRLSRTRYKHLKKGIKI